MTDDAVICMAIPLTCVVLWLLLAIAQWLLGYKNEAKATMLIGSMGIGVILLAAIILQTLVAVISNIYGEPSA